MIEQIHAAYTLATMPVRLLAVAFGVTTTELSALIRRHGWTPRAEGLYAPGTTPAERAAQIRAADRRRQVELYSDAATVDDVRLLRRCGFVVVREGAGARVGNRLVTLAALRAIAARERRLLEMDRPRENTSTAAITQERAGRLQAVPAALLAHPRRRVRSAEVVMASAV